MDSKQRQLFLAVFVSLVAISILGSLGIIKIPTVSPFAHQMFLSLYVAALLPAYYTNRENQKDLLLIETSLKKSLYQQNSRAPEVLKSADVKSQINILRLQIEPAQQESLLRSSLAKDRSNKTNAKQIILERNIILNLLALHIMGRNPIKFGNKTIATEKRDITYITKESDGVMEIILQKTNLYLHQLQKKFDDGRFDKFLYQILKDNNLFLNPDFRLQNIEDSFSKALENFGRDLEKLDKRKDQLQEEASYKPTPNTPEHQTENTSPVLATVSQQSTNLTPRETYTHQPTSLNFTSVEISADEVITKIKESLTSFSIEIENSIILESKKKKIELTIIQGLLPVFTKILNRNLEKPITIGESTAHNPTTLDNIFSATILEYQKTEEYYEWQRELEQEGRRIKATQPLETALELMSLVTLGGAFEEWRKFSDQERKAEEDQKTSAALDLYVSQNYRKFADFLNGFDGLKNIAKLGNVRLKGSYLYGDLLGIKQVEAKDIDLEIFVKNLFFDSESKPRGDDEIKKLITDNFVDYPIDISKVKIGRDPYYAQFELQTSYGKVIDLSFYDSDKPPVSDWIFAIDALRLDLTDVLRSDQPITYDKLLLQKPSLALGFVAKYPNINIDQVLPLIQNEIPLVNPRAQDLVFNTIKKINNKVFNIKTIQSLYKNDDSFRGAFEENWSLVIRRGIDNFQNRCHNSGIENWNTVIQQIRVPEAQLSATSVTSLQSLKQQL